MKRSDMKIGSSSCFTGSLTEEKLAPLAKAGLDYLEYTGNYVFYMRTCDFPKNAEKILETVRASGLEPWSFHLPFSRKLDISNTDKELRAVTIVTNRTLIEAAARAGLGVIGDNHLLLTKKYSSYIFFHSHGEIQRTYRCSSPRCGCC